MQRRIVILHAIHGKIGEEIFYETGAKLCELFDDGWILDPVVGGKTLSTENSRIYHLLKYDQDEQPKPEPEKVIVSMKKVPWDQVDDLLKKGYVPVERWSKEVGLELYKEAE